MSRCFGYPPPGYAGKCVSNESLMITTSTKLQKEKEKAKSDKKHRIKEKKEKEKKEQKKEKKDKKEKKEKRREEQKAKIVADSDTILTQVKSKDVPDCWRKCEPELLEKSNLTEEHEHPCNSSESTENNAKRKRDAEPTKSAQNHGNILRIRLSSAEVEDYATMSDCRKPFSPLPVAAVNLGHQDSKSIVNLPRNLPNAPSGTTATVTHHAQNLGKLVHSPTARSPIVDHQAPESAKVSPLFPERDEVTTSSHASGTPRFHDSQIQKMEKIHGNMAQPSSQERIQFSTGSYVTSWLDDKQLPKEAKDKDPVQSGKVLPPVPERADRAGPSYAPSSSRSHDKKMQKKVAKYRDLLENWVLPSLETVPSASSGDQDWLFRRKREGDDNATKRLKVEEYALPSCGSSLLQPQAVYLADAGIHSMPYTFPF